MKLLIIPALIIANSCRQDFVNDDPMGHFLAILVVAGVFILLFKGRKQKEPKVDKTWGRLQQSNDERDIFQ